MISLFFPLSPVPWQRAGQSKNHFYTKPETANYKQAIALYARNQYKENPLTVCLTVEFIFYIKKPKHPKYIYPTNSDFDNLAKSVSDALNGIIWKDDRLISDSMIRKRYCTDGGNGSIKLNIWLSHEKTPFD